MDVKVPRLMIAGTASGSGKTTITCALLRVLADRGLRVQACKVGPDYIDPLFHERVLGMPSRNIDLFLGDGDLMRSLLVEGGRSSDVTVIEAVMGYYDGIAWGSDASSFDVAQASGTPVVLVADARGRALSLAAEIAGFKSFRTSSQIEAVILNRVSPHTYPQLKAVVEREVGLPVVGYLPRREDVALESRHLGLVMPDEVADLRKRVDALARELTRCVDVEALLQLADGAGALPVEQPPRAAGTPGVSHDQLSVSARFPRASDVPARDLTRRVDVDALLLSADGTGALPAERSHRATDASARDLTRRRGADAPPQLADEAGALPGERSPRATDAPIDSLPGPSLWDGMLAGDEPLAAKGRPPVIAVARDAAFCFYYRDTLSLLEGMGGRIVPVSPLEDERLPEGTCGLYLGGGYPELHAARLSANAVFRAAVRKALDSGMPCIAECGGFEYLHRELEDAQGVPWPMVGTIGGRAYRRTSLGRFGYVTLTARQDSLLFRAGESLPAHEFHYWESTVPGSDLHAQKPQSDRGWDCCHLTETLYAGFPHMYLPGYPELARRFVRACARFSETRGGAE